ncbi:MAG: hypothetical protein EBU46_16390 [Nitrosomonadaceae bacterium]|nr:hypothetical protein [Nitrosomonadaceae bacterium]
MQEPDVHCWLLVQGAPSGSVAVHAPGTPAATFAPLQLPTALEGHCESYQQGAPLRPTTAQYCAPLTIIVALDAQHLLSVAAAFGRPHAPSAHSALALQSAPGGAGGGAIGPPPARLAAAPPRSIAPPRSVALPVALDLASAQPNCGLSQSPQPQLLLKIGLWWLRP